MGLEDGDYVTFSEVEGMEALNGGEPRKITVKGPYTFSIGDVSGLGQYKRGGLYQQVKMPKFVDFKTMSAAMEDPEFLITDFAKFERPQQLHVGFQALHAFVQAQGRLPRPMNAEDALVLVNSARAFVQAEGLDLEVDDKLLSELSYQAMGDLNPMAAFFGGVTAQEVLKAVSGKFHPVKQFLYFDSLESLPFNSTRSEELCQPVGSRYDGQIAVFGQEYQERLGNIKQFLVGAGAIGCEMLKNWAMIGLGTGPQGKIIVTDMDSIEKSNLNRQFLFRPKDVGQMKSDCAARAVQAMNPDLVGHIQCLRERVSPETENIFNEEFWAHPGRRHQRAGQRRGPDIRRQAVRLLPQAAARERHPGHQGQHPGGPAQDHRVVLVVAGPARAVVPHVHAPQLPQQDRAHPSPGRASSSTRASSSRPRRSTCTSPSPTIWSPASSRQGTRRRRWRCSGTTSRTTAP